MTVNGRTPLGLWRAGVLRPVSLSTLFHSLRSCDSASLELGVPAPPQICYPNLASTASNWPVCACCSDVSMDRAAGTCPSLACFMARSNVATDLRGGHKETTQMVAAIQLSGTLQLSYRTCSRNPIVVRDANRPDSPIDQLCATQLCGSGPNGAWQPTKHDRLTRLLHVIKRLETNPPRSTPRPTSCTANSCAQVCHLGNQRAAKQTP